MTDVAPDHLFLRQRLLSVLLNSVAIIVEHHGVAAVVPEFSSRHRWLLQILVEIFDARPGTPGLLREVDFPAASDLRLQRTLPLFFVTDVPWFRQATGVNQVITVAQQTDDGPAPDFLHGVLLKKEVSPGPVFCIQFTKFDGQAYAGHTRYRPSHPVCGPTGVWRGWRHGTWRYGVASYFRKRATARGAW